MKIEITEKQAHQFNMMRRALTQIAKDYQTPEQMRKDSRGDWGLDFEEAIEMAYENIQLTAKIGCKGIKELAILSPWHALKPTEHILHPLTGKTSLPGLKTAQLT